MSAYLGHKVKGVPGAVVATAAHILPTCVAMAALFAAVNVLSHSKIVSGMIGAVTPVIAVMLGIMAYELGKSIERLRVACRRAFLYSCIFGSSGVFHPSRHHCHPVFNVWRVPL